MSQKLAVRIDKQPGLPAHVVSTRMERMGVVTWEQFGRLPDDFYKQALRLLPAKRITHIEDLINPALLGPGHFNTLDCLRQEAKADVRRLDTARIDEERRRREADYDSDGDSIIDDSDGDSTAAIHGDGSDSDSMLPSDVDSGCDSDSSWVIIGVGLGELGVGGESAG